MDLKTQVKNPIAWGVVVILIILAVNYIPLNFSQQAFITDEKFAYLDIDATKDAVIVNTGNQNKFGSVYGAFGVYVNDEFVGYYTFFTAPNDDDGGFQNKRIEVPIRTIATEEINKVEIYYDWGETREEQYKQYASKQCGQLVNPFRSDHLFSQAQAYNKYTLCSSGTYQYVSNGGYPNVWYWQGDGCYALDTFRKPTIQVDNNYCLRFPSVYNGYTDLTQTEFDKIKTWNKEEQFVVLNEPIQEEPPVEETPTDVKTGFNPILIGGLVIAIIGLLIAYLKK